MATPLLAGRYAHQRELGRGASGRVLLAEDRVGEGTVAIKIVSGADAERLRWEADLLGSLSHPNLAPVHELLTVAERVGPPWSIEAGAVALVEEHVDGPSAGVAAAALEDLDARLRFAVIVGGAVARALGAIHAAGLVHQDVKPGNLVVPEDPARARLVDLGLCRPPGGSATISGTVGFLAPEALL
ncbi:MAG: protein kinase, partial [Myxococcales bacterium]|nr:protein kinase [Myxococcales bacterium]